MGISIVKSIVVSSLGLGLLSLGGCAQMNSVGQNIWGATKNVGQSAGYAVSSLLRPAPQQMVSFENVNTGQDQVYYDFMRTYHTPVRRAGVAKRNFAAIPTYVPYEEIIYVPAPVTADPVQAPITVQAPMTASYESMAMPHSEIVSIPAPLVETEINVSETVVPSESFLSQPGVEMSAPVQSQITGRDEGLAGGPSDWSEMEPSTQDFSYVKLAGGSDPADWQACQNEVGAFADTANGQVRIAPAFDLCMRNRGYVPELEVIEYYDPAYYRERSL